MKCGTARWVTGPVLNVSIARYATVFRQVKHLIWWTSKTDILLDSFVFWEYLYRFHRGRCFRCLKTEAERATETYLIKKLYDGRSPKKNHCKESKFVVCVVDEVLLSLLAVRIIQALHINGLCDTMQCLNVLVPSYCWALSDYRTSVGSRRCRL